MSKMDKDTLMQVYPPVLDRDKLFNALGQITAHVLGEAFQNINHESIYTQIEKLDEPLLDQLAKDFGIAWYEYDRDLATKRDVIATAFSTMRVLGTPGGMKRAINAVYDDAAVEEWFDYEGDPFHFRVIVTNEYKADENAKLLVLIGLFKNVRSVLDEVEYYSLNSVAEMSFVTDTPSIEVVDTSVML